MPTPADTLWHGRPAQIGLTEGLTGVCRHGQGGNPGVDQTAFSVADCDKSADGSANYPVLAPRLKKISEIKGHALMIHAGGDNHADMPKPLGGGGDRMACGVI